MSVISSTPLAATPDAQYAISGDKVFGYSKVPSYLRYHSWSIRCVRRCRTTDGSAVPAMTAHLFSSVHGAWALASYEPVADRRAVGDVLACAVQSRPGGRARPRTAGDRSLGPRLRRQQPVETPALQPVSTFFSPPDCRGRPPKDAVMAAICAGRGLLEAHMTQRLQGLLRRWRARSGRLGRCVAALVECQHRGPASRGSASLRM